jgi:hypothetical protein
MNRLTPLVSRRTRHPGNFAARASFATPSAELEAARWIDDAKLFAGGWVAGLILFGTLIA